MDSSRDSSMGSEEQVSRDERPFSFSETRAGSGDTQSISISSGVGSASVAQSRDSSGSSSEEVEEHRNMMLASLLEDYIRTRATDFLNSTNPSRNYTRQSPEVQTLARQLFADTSRKLSTSGIVSEFASSDAGRGTRRQYLTALDNLMAGSQGSATSLQSPVHDLGIDISHLSIVPHPGNDMHLTVQLPRPQSHYQSSFQELSLLGKGGFGKVYQCFNPLDQKTYAVKKIQLSPTLALRFRNGRLDKLQHILREVQALATLEHPNIVRYHATWFEEPQQPSRNVISHDSRSRAHTNQRQQLLLDSRAFSEIEDSKSEPSMTGGIVFEEDSVPTSDNNRQLVGERQPADEQTSCEDTEEDSLAPSTSNIFTDGKSHHESHQGHDERKQGTWDAVGHTLYIQMSLYPMTLAQYISTSPAKEDAPKHCFHLVPSLRLLQCIHTGLQYIHGKGYIHRDIKPGNIFLSAPEVESQGGYCNLSCPSCYKNKDDVPPRWLNPRIGDFGLVAQLAKGELPLSSHQDASNETTESDKPIGTTYYRPPFSRGTNDEKVDIFALGVVLTELVCSFTTAMERVDTLKELQKGQIPSSMKQTLKHEGYSTEVIEEVLMLAEGMVDPNPHTRLSSPQLGEAIKGLLHKCDKA